MAIVTTHGSPDLARLPEFLTRLMVGDSDSHDVARLLLDDGWEVASFWGPVQMDVWLLILRRAKLCVRFGIERGYSDGVGVGSVGVDDATAEGLPAWNDLRPFGVVVFAWARATGRNLSFTDPEDLARGHGAYAAVCLAWLSEGNDETVDRVYEEWRTFHLARGILRSNSRGRPDAQHIEALHADALIAMTAAARSR